MSDYDFFLNLGGIANISFNNPDRYIAFDICAANRVMNMLVAEIGKEYDAEGAIAAGGKMNNELLEKLNALDYYKLPAPKSLANDFGTDLVYPIVKSANLELSDALRTYVEHIVVQIRNAISLGNLHRDSNLSEGVRSPSDKLLATGGGALNSFLVQRLSDLLKEINIEVIIPAKQLINFKEALVMAFMGVLRWRQEYNVLSSVTGATRDTINGALWMGEEA